ncbi:MAG: aspartate carbamoyltransferase [Nitrososphaeria archaeon]|nr:aspartate carbamoyltransferase [Nitrososphaeria archaeon]NIQ32747.1 aspartate carbamoyltransferase [Nitrososphaeria archaeon]
MAFEGKDILALKTYTREELDYILDTAQKFEGIAGGRERSNLLDGKILATAFFEPSTRTRNSSEAAMLRLGGGVIGFDSPEGTSVAKGESLEDTVKTLGQYSDVIVVRHSQIGSAHRAAEATDVPVINGGDGSNEHPTQGLLDLYTIRKEKGGIDGLKVAIAGDIKHTRSAHSLAYGLSNYKVKQYFVAPQPLQLQEEMERELVKRGVEFEKLSSITEVIDKVDVLYVTRLQEERFPNQKEAEKFRGSYTIYPRLLEKAKKEMIIMHHLPRLWEIPLEVDETPHARYFQQEFYGLVVRCALLCLVLGAIN